MVQSATMTGKPLIESDRVEGTTVYDRQGNNVGSIKRLMIEKLNGRVAYAVMSFGSFLGIGGEEHAIPWGKLTYDTLSTVIKPTLAKVSCREHRLSHATETGTGRIAAGSENCTITIGRPIIGVNKN